MGKLGAGELNYSSDVDLIVLYDPECMRRRPAATSRQNRFVRLARDLVRLMEERTADGYVFRTDLRLRPDPGATPPAISVLAAEVYYETLGQNWERAAMIKARPVAGDRAAGERFLARIRPFVWRQHLDFAAIRDIHSIKRQIHAPPRRRQDRRRRAQRQARPRRHPRDRVLRPDAAADLGRARPGAARPAPARRSGALVGAGKHRREAARADLADAYVFLRHVEHRLQMVDDRQTHTLPEDAAGLARIASFSASPTPTPSPAPCSTICTGSSATTPSCSRTRRR